MYFEVKGGANNLPDLPDGRYVCERIDKEPRTEQQNRFLWGVVYPQIVKKLSDK